MNENKLINMLMSQLTLQQKLHEKRNTITPDDVTISRTEKLKQACYYATCTNIELAEFIDQLHIDHCNKTEEVILELTDAFIFLLNQLLFANVIPSRTLESYYQDAVKRYDSTNGIKFHEIIGEYNAAIGRFYQNTRFKTWKTYTEQDDNIYALIPLVDDVIVSFLQLYVKLSISVDDICNYYYKKFDINTQRQEVGGKYEKA